MREASTTPAAEQIEARAAAPAAREIRARDEAKREAGRWRESLSRSDAMDMTDMLDNGGYAGAPEPTERAVLGRFTRMVGDKPKLADIIHDAIEHYQPFGSMVERIGRETGREGFPSAAEERGARSLYNATLARRSGWEERR